MEMFINKNLSIYIDELEDVKNKIRELESTKKDIMCMISNEMGSNEILMDEHGTITHTYKNSVRKSLDGERIKKERPDIYYSYLKESNVRTFLIKEKGEKEC